MSATDPASKAAASEMLEKAVRADEIKNNPFAYAFEIALAYDHLGNEDKTIQWIERSEAAGTHSFNLIEADPRLFRLHRNPRFERLVQKLHNRPDR